MTFKVAVPLVVLILAHCEHVLLPPPPAGPPAPRVHRGLQPARPCLRAARVPGGCTCKARVQPQLAGSPRRRPLPLAAAAAKEQLLSGAWVQGATPAQLTPPVRAKDCFCEC